MANDFSILKQIWQNRGFGKYTLFGGLKFYLRLRIQFFAYLFAAITALLLFVGVYQTYENYEPTYWRETVYYEPSELPTFKLEANTFYTFEMSDDLDYALVNGNYFAAPGSLYLYYSYFYKLPYKWRRTFHVKFPYDVKISIMPDLDMVINLVLTEKIEVYKYKQEGTYIDYRYFEPKFYNPPPPVEKKNKNSKKKKKKK
ncbi:MAG: hypothetical protein WAT71_07565 [Ignavibacteria bacterium]